MANQRSPNCPQITFEEAAEKGRIVYDKEHTHPAAREVVASSLGYSGINGRSLSMIGALRQYGILEGSGEALRITDDAVAYFELEDGYERQEALLRMLFHPPFFEQIRTDFGATLPSESNLKHYLIKNGFLPKAAEDVIRVYRENLRLVENTPKRYNENQQSGEKLMGAPNPALALTKSPETLPPHPAIWSQNYSFPLSRGAKAELTIKGEVNREALARLKAHIELTIQALSEDDSDKVDVTDALS